MKKHYVIAVYDVDRHYGGPEEGGWYYTDGPIVGIEAVTVDKDMASDRCFAKNQELRAEADNDYERLVATVVELPRRELHPELAWQTCHSDMDDLEEADYVTRWDIPTSYAGDYRPHYC